MVLSETYTLVLTGISCSPDEFLANMVRLGFLPEQVLQLLNRMPYRIMDGLPEHRATHYNQAFTGAGGVIAITAESER